MESVKPSEAERVECRKPDQLGLLILVGVMAIFFFGLGIVSLKGSSVVFGVFGLAIGCLFAWVAFKSVSNQAIVATRHGLEWIGRQAHSYRWEEVEGIGAQRRTVGHLTFIEYSVYFFDEPTRVFTDRWSNSLDLAASIQAGQPAQGDAFDLEAALRDAPRGDPSQVLRTDPATVKRFVEAARLALSDVGVEARMSPQRLRAMSSHGVYELFSIGNRLIREPQKTWRKSLKAHFKKIAASRSAMETLGDRFPTFESAKEFLRVQLTVPSTSLKAVVQRPFCSTPVVQIVAIDLGELETYVTRDQVASWNVTEEEVFRAAHEQNEKLPELLSQPIEHAGGGRLFGGPYAAARALEIARGIETDPFLGCLIALPARDFVIALPIGDRHDLMWLTVGGFVRTIISANLDAAAPIGTQIYWVQGGEFTLIPCVLTDKGPTFVPPEALNKRVFPRADGAAGT